MAYRAQPRGEAEPGSHTGSKEAELPSAGWGYSRCFLPWAWAGSPDKNRSQFFPREEAQTSQELETLALDRKRAWGRAPPGACVKGVCWALGAGLQVAITARKERQPGIVYLLTPLTRSVLPGCEIWAGSWGQR